MAQADLKQINLQQLSFTLEGTTPLICHKWSEKAIKEIDDKQRGKAKQPKAPKDPDQLYEDSLYRLSDGGYGFPAVAFKAAAVRAGTLAGMKMTETRQMFRVLADEGDLVRIAGNPRKRQDMVRIQQTSDVRYRGEFPEWSVTLKVLYDADVITPEQLINLFNRAGFSVGVGEWRMEKNGTNGSFRVDDSAPMQSIRTKKGK